MIGYAILLLACANIVYGESPNYVEAYRKLNFTRNYFASQLRLIFPKPDISKPEDRRRLSFAILAGVTGAEVKALYYRSNATAREIASNNIPYAWSNYNEISRKTTKLFEDLYISVKQATDLIDSCKGGDVQCSDIVQKKTIENPNIYQKPADLLLSIGDSATVFNNNLDLIEDLTRRNREIPYLLNYVNSPQYQRILKQFLTTYKILRRKRI